MEEEEKVSERRERCEEEEGENVWGIMESSLDRKAVLPCDLTIES